MFQYFSILTTIFTDFHWKNTHLSPRGSQMESCWGPGGVLGSLLGPFFASLGPSGDPWAPPGGCPVASWHHFPQFRSPKSLPGGFFIDFSMIFNKNTIFPIWKKQISHIPAYPISQLFLILPVPPITLSLHSSNHPNIQSSNWAWRNARSVWIIIIIIIIRRATRPRAVLEDFDSFLRLSSLPQSSIYDFSHILDWL